MSSYRRYSLFSFFAVALSFGALMHGASRVVRNEAADGTPWFRVFPGELSRPTVKEAEQSECLVGTLSDIGSAADMLWVENKEHDESFVAKLHDLFAPIDKHFLARLITQVLSNEAILNDITQASYRNVTGFLKVVFATGGENAWKIRLHIWTPKEEKEHPHNHKWGFYSKVVSEQLSQELYAREGRHHAGSCRYTVREPVSLMPTLETGEQRCPCRDNFALVAKCARPKPVYLAREAVDVISAGQSYFMPYHLIHSIVPSARAVSLVFTSRKVRENSEVFVMDDGVNADIKRISPSVGTRELRQELLRAQAILQ